MDIQSVSALIRHAHVACFSVFLLGKHPIAVLFICQYAYVPDHASLCIQRLCVCVCLVAVQRHIHGLCFWSKKRGWEETTGVTSPSAHFLFMFVFCLLSCDRSWVSLTDSQSTKWICIFLLPELEIPLVSFLCLEFISLKVAFRQ